MGGWGTQKLILQQAADSAALAGALNYSTSASPSAALTAAANVAELNNATGTAARTTLTPVWSGTSYTTTMLDNTITTSVSWTPDVPGAVIQATITKTIPGTLSATFGPSSATLSATSVATVTGVASPQPCIVALSATGSVSGAGSTQITMPNCAIRSNNTVDVHGGGNLTTAGIYAAKAINIDSWIPAAGQHPNVGTIADPYATNTAMQSAMTAAKNLTGVSSIACSKQVCTGLTNGSSCAGMGTGTVTCAMKPGNYGSFQVTSGGPYTFNFAPGLYLFSGNMSFTNYTTSNGSGVTLVTAGNYNGANSFYFNLSAPSTAQVASTGGVAGVVLASSSTTTTTFSGSAAVAPTGVFYFPNAVFDASASSMFGTAGSTCIEIIASSVKLSGGGYFNSSCGAVNAVAFGSLTSSTSKPKLSM